MKASHVTEGLPSAVVFENQINLMKASEFCTRFGYSMKTIYEWKYRPKRNKVPAELVVKFRGKLFIRTDILRTLVISTSGVAQAALQEE
jgi:hypothetical protein